MIDNYAVRFLLAAESSGAHVLLVEALKQLDLIEADIATRARLQGIIDELEAEAAG